MIPREQIDSLSDRIKIIEDEATELQAQAFTLRTEREELISEMILSEGLLSNTDWVLRLNGDQSPYLDFNGRLDEAPMSEMVELAKTDWHCWFELEDGIRLQFDDNDITLTFREAKQLMPFAKKNKLKVTGQGISDKLAKLKRETAALEDVVHQFNL